MEERIYGLDTGGYDPQKVVAMADWELIFRVLLYYTYRMAYEPRYYQGLFQGLCFGRRV